MRSFILAFGIVGVGYAWIVSYGIGAVIVGVIVKRGVDLVFFKKYF